LNFFIPIFLISCLISQPASAGSWGPESFSPALQEGQVPRSMTTAPGPAEQSPFAKFLVGGVHFFQKFISPVDGDRCTMAPTCSHFALQALKKHGALIGFMMSADRIVHEYEEHRFVSARWDGKTYRYLDPVENNDFWFTAPATEDNGQTKGSTRLP